MSSAPGSPLPHTRRSQGGFMLVEVLVSAVLLLIMSAALLSVIETSSARQGQNKSRSAAASLGRSFQQQYRAQQNFADTSVAPRTIGPTNVTVGKTTYTVTTTGAWVSDSTSSDDACSAAAGSDGTIDYLKVHTEVTWPGMKVKPVTYDSLVAPPVAINATTGTVVIRVLRADTTPISGISVTLGTRAATTNDAGCVVFAGVPAGTQSGSAAVTGLTDIDGNATHVEDVDVTARQVNRADFTFYTSIPRTVTFDTQFPSDASSPSTAARVAKAKTATLSNPSTSVAMGDPAGADNTSLTAASLPAGVYNGYAGNCVGNDPGQYGGTTQTVAPTGTALRVPTLSIRAQKVTTRSVLIIGTETDYEPADTMTVVIKPDTTTSGTKMTAACTPAKYTLIGTDDYLRGSFGTSTDTYALKRVQLPYGTYKMCVSVDGYKADNLAITNTAKAGTLTPVVSIYAGGSTGLLSAVLGTVTGLLTGSFGSGATTSAGTCS